MRLIIIVVAITALGGGGTILLRNTASVSDKNAAVPEQALYVVQRGKLTVTITENGSLMAKNSEKISAQSRRGGKVTFLVEEGKTVAQNEVLCKLDTTELETQKQQLELDVVKTEADGNTAKTELEIQKSENLAAIEKAKIALAKAQKELERYIDGDAPKEQRNLEVAIKEAETKHSHAKKKFEDSKKLLEQDYINKSQVEQDEIDFERSEIQLISAQRDLEIFKTYTRPMMMTDKNTAVSDAQRGLDNADKRALSTLRQKEVAVESQDLRLKSLKTQLVEVKKEIENFIIVSPSPGIVIYGDPNEPWYRTEIKLGAQVWGGNTLFTIPDLRVMQVQVAIHEADINVVKEGQVATITMDTYPGLVLKGTITKIAQVAGGGSPGYRMDSAEVKKFTVNLTLDSTNDLVLKPGISAKAAIFIEERENVLYVPLQCVFLEEGTHYCYIMRSGAKPEKVKVKPELSNDTYMQIAEGVSEGDRVLLYNPQLNNGKSNTAAPESAHTQPASTAVTTALPRGPNG